MSIRLSLLPQYQRLALEILPELARHGFQFLLEHQQAHFQALEDHHLVVNSNQTGTGKTLASSLHLLRPEMQRAGNDTLVIAPTNELIAQHAADFDGFVTEHGLEHIVVQVNASVITKVIEANPQEKWRRGEAFYYILQNPRDPKIAPHLEVKGNLDQKRPLIVVTNPDLFYYVLQGVFARLDERNLVVTFLGKFHYLVIDEFHYYDPKQAAAFFYYVALSHRLGFFKEGRRISFLTATPEPQVTTFFRNLEKLDVRVAWIDPMPVKPVEIGATMSATRLDLEFAASDNGIAEIVKKETTEIRNRIRAGRDVAVISYSLADISQAGRCFAPAEFQTITGAVQLAFRRGAGKSPLILATPTVDIGYNFSREGKNRQGLDDLYFTAKFRDEFWQRLGRPGRVVGKVDQTVSARAVCVVSSAVYEHLAKAGLDGREYSRDELKNLLTEDMFAPRAFFWDYLANEGFFEIAHALSELRSTLTQASREILPEIYELLVGIFGASKPPYWKQVQGRLARYEALTKETKAIHFQKAEFPSKLLREFAAEYKLRHSPTDDTEEKIEREVGGFPESGIDQLRLKMQASYEFQEKYSRFIRQEQAAINGIFSFRNVFSGLPVMVFDRKHIFHPEQSITCYDVLHLLKYYELEFYADRAQFWRDAQKTVPALELAEWEEETSPIYVKVRDHREPEDRLHIQFGYQPPSLDLFQKLDTDRIRAFSGISLRARKFEYGGGASYPLPPEVVNLFAQTPIPLLAFSDRTFRANYKRLKAAGYFTSKLVVNDDNREQTFETLIGTAAYFIARRAFGLRCALERHEDFFIC